MATQNVILIVALLSLLACQRQDTNETQQPNLEKSPVVKSPPAPVVTDQMIEAEREAQQAIDDAENELGYFYRERLGRLDLRPGEWVEENGSKICIGFLTRFEDEDFCAAEIPRDWEPFEFNGHWYYMQPLSETSE